MNYIIDKGNVYCPQCKNKMKEAYSYYYCSECHNAWVKEGIQERFYNEIIRPIESNPLVSTLEHRKGQLNESEEKILANLVKFDCLKRNLIITKNGMLCFVSDPGLHKQLWNLIALQKEINDELNILQQNSQGQ